MNVFFLFSKFYSPLLTYIPLFILQFTLISETIILHLRFNKNIFYYYQIAFCSIFLMIVYLSIRGKRPNVKYIKIISSGITLLSISFIYIVYYHLYILKTEDSFMIGYDYEFFLLIEFGMNIFVIGILAVVVFLKLKTKKFQFN